MQHLLRGRRSRLLVAALLSAAAIVLPLWGMTLVSTQYPEGLRLVVYPSYIRGDVSEINALNHYIGMTPISDDFFGELRLLPASLALIAVACGAAAFVRHVWMDLLPLGLMTGLAGFGAWSMHHRLYQFGHDLDPTAPIRITPFTPPMLGTNQIAQFATYAYFSWGTFLMLAAGVFVVLVLVDDLRGSRPAPRLRVAPAPA